MSRYRNLLAKSWDSDSGASPPSYARLLTHLRAVQAAGESIVNSCGATILANLGLDPGVWEVRLLLAVSMACLIHDLGKASSYFQGMVRGKPDFPPQSQPIRHELLTVLILLRNCGGVADWVRKPLRKCGDDAVAERLFQTVIAAVGGHHVKLDSDWQKAFPTERGGGLAIDIYLGHADLAPLFDPVQKPGDECWSLLPSDSTYPGKALLAFNQASLQWQDTLDTDPEWKHFAAVVKALTVAADVAGSALLEEGVSPRNWIADVLRRHPTQNQLRAVVEVRLGGRELRPFQQAIANTENRVTLVEAGCGSGKTVAAYLWAARHAQGRKLFFCYPTTGTATEGFLDYVADSDVEAELMHSRAQVDLDRVAMSRDSGLAAEHEDEQLRINSLKAWAPEAVVCTVDTVLALVRNNRRGLYSSPAILSGVFVFDELHAYNDEMFAALVALIRTMPGAPFLLMSASLPAHRKAFLLKHLGDIGQIPPPAELESLPRYLIESTEAGCAFALAAERVREGKRVLWVCNTVARAQAIFEEARKSGIPAVAYHSRFRYRDRVDRHREVVDRFAAPGGTGLLAVTTQVAEMSLDLDADLLISELAPIPALIQRLGRLNRRVSEQNPGTPRRALMIKPDDAKPYTDNELAKACDWLSALTSLGRGLSQQDLSEQFRRQADEQPPLLELRMEWLDSGWCAFPGSVRGESFSVNVVLDMDADACRKSTLQIIERSLPMPYRSRMETWPRLRGTLIAPPDAIVYDPHKGATWAN